MSDFMRDISAGMQKLLGYTERVHAVLTRALDCVLVAYQFYRKLDTFFADRGAWATHDLFRPYRLTTE